MRTDPLVEDLQRDPGRAVRHFARASLRGGRRRAISATRLSRERELAHARQRMGAVVVEQRDLVIVAAERILCEIGDDQRQLLAATLVVGVARDVVGLRREAHADTAHSAAPRR